MTAIESGTKASKHRLPTTTGDDCTLASGRSSQLEDLYNQPRKAEGAVMEVLGKILRTISLALLFGGSIAVVISAITLVKAAKAKGIPVEIAAATNAPVFLAYAKVNLGAGIGLMIGEGLDYAKRRLWTKSTIAQYTCSLLCVATTMIFALGIVPPMEQLLPAIATDAAAKEQFDQLHKTSQMVFGTTILLACVSLILPLFGALKTAGDCRANTEG